MAEKLKRHISLTKLNINNLEISHANSIQATEMVQNSTDDLVAVINTYNCKKYTNNGGSKPKCTFCEMIGHTIDKCYKKHGYPPGWVPGFESKAKQHGTASVVNNVTDLGVTSDQFQKLMAAIQNRMRQPSSSGTAASISLIPKFNEDNIEGKSSIPFVNSLSLCNSTWIVDSGATNHITCSLETFDEYYVVERDEVSLPTGELVAIKHKGNIRLESNLWLKDVIHIPSFQFNILSMSKLLQDTSYNMVFTSGQCLIQEPLGMTVGLATQEKGLYLMMKTPLNSILDHRKLVMQLDDFSRFTWLHLMKMKSEAKELIKQFHSFVFTQFGALINVLRSDNDLEFDMKEFFGDKGIIHQTSCVNTPQQNAVVEQKHQHILNVARALRFQAQLPLEFWGLCLACC
ncbi:PREDICTED: uncharacterized protein LOC109166981 [Ipomoea nil]|uniref:uncharacterized protein LOC109166981 n=1 Tax=Ipomoea nil TaxID=35883 RepID=UPI0009017209|nr:PREDICTED: uncharacterized protein LOC109166981 [Ipomoea nil]